MQWEIQALKVNRPEQIREIYLHFTSVELIKLNKRKHTESFHKERIHLIWSLTNPK